MFNATSFTNAKDVHFAGSNNDTNIEPATVRVFALKTVSWLLVWSDNSTNILQNHCGPAIALEKKDTVDVVAMGNSNFYCSIDPTRVWEQQGIPMYIWGAPSHRIYEIQHDLKTLFKKQSPKVVFIEASCLMRDKSTNAWNQKVKADVASVFQIVANLIHMTVQIQKLHIQLLCQF